MTTPSLYERQEVLPLSIPESVAVVGCGGVGSWVILNLALSGVKKIYTIDPDTVSLNNLNRTPFRLRDIGAYKVTAMMSLILERRPNCDIIIMPETVEDVLRLAGTSSFSKAEVFIDCRDTSTPLPFEDKVYIIGGYDGHNITIHENPKSTSIWGEGDSRYTVTPSWLCPPQLIANIITSYILSMDLPRIRGVEKIRNFSIFSILKKL